MGCLQERTGFKAAFATSERLSRFGQVAWFTQGSDKANRGEPGSWHGAGNRSVISAQLGAQSSSRATPGTWIYMKVSLLITISVGGLVHPVSPKNEGVDSQTQADESQKAELVTPWLVFRFARAATPGAGAAGLCGELPRAAAGSGARPAPRGLWLPETRASRVPLLPAFTILPRSSLRSVLLPLEKPCA